MTACVVSEVKMLLSTGKSQCNDNLDTNSKSQATEQDEQCVLIPSVYLMSIVYNISNGKGMRRSRLVLIANKAELRCASWWSVCGGVSVVVGLRLPTNDRTGTFYHVNFYLAKLCFLTLFFFSCRIGFSDSARTLFF